MVEDATRSERSVSDDFTCFRHREYECPLACQRMPDEVCIWEERGHVDPLRPYQRRHHDAG